MPPLHDWPGADDLAAALLVSGPAEPGGMGDVPLSWQGIAAWARLTETQLSPGDFEALREMSAEYVSACEDYRHNSKPAPYGDLDSEDAPKPSVAMTRAAFRGAGKGKAG